MEAAGSWEMESFVIVLFIKQAYYYGPKIKQR